MSIDLKQYFDTRLSDLNVKLDERAQSQKIAVDAALFAQEKAVQAALVSAEKAVTKAETAAEKRFESVNEFRAQLTDQAATFISRVEGDARYEALDVRVSRNENVISNIQGRMIAYTGGGAIIGGIIVALITHMLI